MDEYKNLEEAELEEIKVEETGSGFQNEQDFSQEAKTGGTENRTQGEEDFTVMSVRAEKISKNKRKYNKIVYCLLAWFLGLWGVHSFYAGKTLQGIIFILTTIIGIILSSIGIGVFIMFIEGAICIIQIILAVMKSSDENGNIS